MLVSSCRAVWRYSPIRSNRFSGNLYVQRHDGTGCPRLLCHELKRPERPAGKPARRDPGLRGSFPFQKADRARAAPNSSARHGDGMPCLLPGACIGRELSPIR